MSAGWGWDGAFGMNRADAVEAEDGVEVDQPAALEFGHLGVRQLHLGSMLASKLGQAAADADDGTAPQLGGVGVPYDSG